MAYLRGSSNYVWCTTDVLGKGATGAVFRGVNKHDGEAVAVKTFNQISHMRPHDVQMREFDVLKKVNHENVVKLLAIEEEQDGRGKVIVMELCTGGSLFNILDDPENTFGLAEDEFLLVLEHLAAGMKHLREKHLVHRDLKPGNIMKFIGEDGKTIYKVTDFGAARELDEDGEFMSLYGTEEYLHPDMYERAVLRKTGGKPYSAHVDLWSIGVTLFHVATGTLPFRPHGGRKNRDMMHYIVTKKESGVISGTQSSENGDIEWKRELPETTQLSSGLKLLLTPLLAGLVEVDTRKRSSFENFFQSVTSLLMRKRIHLFYVNKIETLRIYLDEKTHKTIGNLQCLIMEQTDISPEHQILLGINGISYSMDEKFENLPITSLDNPLVLCHREKNSVNIDWATRDLVKFPTFPNLVSLENDATLGKQITAVGHTYKRRIEKLCSSINLIGKAVHIIAEVVNRDLTFVSKDSTQVQGIISSLSQQLGLMSHFHKSASAFITFAFPISQNSQERIEICNNGITDKVLSMKQSAEIQQDSFRKLTSHLLTLEQPIKLLFHKLVQNRDLLNEWENAVADIPDISTSPIKSQTHVNKLRDSWARLLHNRAASARNFNYNDEQFHILERIKMQEKSKALAHLLHEECHLAIIRLTEVLSDWYKRAKAGFIQTEILVKDMKQFQERLEIFMIELTEVVENYQTDIEAIKITLKELEHCHSFQPNHLHNGMDLSIQKSSMTLTRHSDKPTKDYMKTFNRGIRELTNVQEEVWTILRENAELVNQFQTLTMSILTPAPSIQNSQSLSSNKSEEI